MRHLSSINEQSDDDSVIAMPVQEAEATIGMYRIVKVLGTGGMGSVYLGEHVLLGRWAAIKVLLPAFSENAEIVERFFNEARALTLVVNPGIVQIFDFGYHSDGRAFIIMEFLDGEPMDRRLRRVRRFSALECMRMSRLLCSSLDVVHAQGIVHRDLKPSNIFIVPDATPPGGERTKIFDFGIAKQSGARSGQPRTRAGVLMGTPMYMSPEQCRGVGKLDHRSDIYSLACVMFAMLTGRPPFGSRGPGELVVAHLREPPPLASSLVRGVPGVIDDILQRCLQKSPAERFQSMAELANAISIAEQSLVRSSAPDLAADPPDVPRRSAVPSPDIPGPFHAGPTTLNGASGQSLAPIALVERSTWKPVAAVILGAALVGVFGAIVFSRVGGDAHGTAHMASSAPRPSEPSGASARSPAEIGAHTLPNASPTPAIEPNGALTPGDPGRAIPEPSPREPIGAAPPQPQRSRPGPKHSPQPDMKGTHASSRGPAVESQTVADDNSQDVARGD